LEVAFRPVAVVVIVVALSVSFDTPALVDGAEGLALVSVAAVCLAVRVESAFACCLSDDEEDVTAAGGGGGVGGVRVAGSEGFALWGGGRGEVFPSFSFSFSFPFSVTCFGELEKSSDEPLLEAPLGLFADLILFGSTLADPSVLSLAVAVVMLAATPCASEPSAGCPATDTATAATDSTRSGVGTGDLCPREVERVRREEGVVLPVVWWLGDRWCFLWMTSSEKELECNGFIGLKIGAGAEGAFLSSLAAAAPFLLSVVRLGLAAAVVAVVDALL